MDPQFEELAERLKSELATIIADQLKKELTTVVVDQFAATESRLVGQYKIHAEEMNAQVKLAADGYAATLDSIDRRLKRLETKWDTTISDHDRVLASHNQRISSLERKRR